ncbi:hypothetical protein CAFE_18890 [Caprobacter fermentans]|uniref:Phage protein n=1 Tax=Caproicibacter fermentans TaxID=2576756 RepID=A0A6N8HZB2_9FIRM|nr:hypothetical protein [Caproicibacter fermentans]MVB11181.1 hypothetical protein [Caproicibacter fermentans]
MKTLTLKLGEKIYTTGRITAWQSREAMAVEKDTLAVARKGKELDKNDLSSVEQMLQQFEDASIRKANLICDVYGNKFTVDELEKSLSNEEIERCLVDIVNGISGVVEKN